ncbi:acyltransferase [Prevotella communis]|uniref:acyltransferase family protein n=1 Tax=Prevotella communis TaxID=2913614 RepID=UPI001EDC3D16|nr:acyltransferase [Prevotella communis]UKK60389.1 acyltransferase [Prevotella communis]
MNQGMQVKSNRDSNMELLRIISMLLVMVLHADFAAISVPTIEQCHDSAFFSFFRFFVESLAVVAVNVFVMLSGWYGIKPSFKKLGSFLFQVYFLIFVVYLCFWGFGSGHHHSTVEWITILFFNQYWFIQCYIILYLFSPVLNSFINNTTRGTYRFVLLSLFFIQFVYGCLPFASVYGWFNDGYSPLTFFFLYLLARYVKQYVTLIENYHSVLYVIGWILTALVIALFGFLTVYVGFGNSLIMYFYGYSSPFVILGAMLLLLALSRISIKNSLINWIASSVFTVYILHCHECIFNPYYKSQIAKWYSTGFTTLYIVKVTTLIIVLFVSAIFVDKIRILIQKSIVKLIKSCHEN